jgi:hypothetical protein
LLLFGGTRAEVGRPPKFTSRVFLLLGGTRAEVFLGGAVELSAYVEPILAFSDVEASCPNTRLSKLVPLIEVGLLVVRCRNCGADYESGDHAYVRVSKCKMTAGEGMPGAQLPTSLRDLLRGGMRAIDFF